MNIEEIEERVRATVDSLDVLPADVNAVVAEGERRRKRTRTMGGALATVGAVVVVAVLSQVLAGPSDDRAVPPTTGPTDGRTSPATPEPSPEGNVDELIQVIPLDQRGDPINLSGTTFDGTALNVADSRGDVVLVPFWGSWCAPCRESVALVDELAANLGVEVVGVAVDETSPEDFQAAEAEAAVSFESIFDPSEEVLDGLGDVRPSGVPAMLVLDPEGRVAAYLPGPFSSPISLTRVIALLKQQDAVNNSAPLSNLLTIYNRTDEPIWVVFSNGNRAQVKPAHQVQLGSRQACSLMPLTATTLDGTTLDSFDEPCAGQAWNVLTSGSSTSTPADPASQGGSPVIAVQGWDDYPTAEVVGPLRLVDGCLLIGDAVAVWADGSTWDAATRSVVFESGEPVAVGDQFAGGGGYYKRGNLDGLNGLDVGSVVECLDRTDSVEAVIASPSD